MTLARALSSTGPRSTVPEGAGVGDARAMTELPFTADHRLDAATLTAAGLHSHDLERLVRSGRLHPLVRGWYATRRPDGPLDRHERTARALVRHFAGRVGVSHHSRLVVAGLPTWRADLSLVTLTRRDDRGSRSRRGYRVFPIVPGLVMTDTPRSSGHCSSRTSCCRRWVGSAGLAGSDPSGPCSVTPTAGTSRRARPARATRSGRWVCRTPRRCSSRPRGTKRVDALLDDAPVVVEFDGRVKDTGPESARRREDPLVAEKRREDAVRDERFEVVRVVWAELDDVAALGRRVRAARARALARVA